MRREACKKVQIINKLANWECIDSKFAQSSLFLFLWSLLRMFSKKNIELVNFHQLLLCRFTFMKNKHKMLLCFCLHDLSYCKVLYIIQGHNRIIARAKHESEKRVFYHILPSQLDCNPAVKEKLLERKR